MDDMIIPALAEAPQPLPVANVRPVMSESALFETLLTKDQGGVYGVYLNRREALGLHDFNALARHMDLALQNGTLRHRPAEAGAPSDPSVVLLNSEDAAHLASNTTGGVRAAAAQCFADMRTLERQGYRDVRMALDLVPEAPSLHLSPGRELVYANYTGAPLTVFSEANPDHASARPNGYGASALRAALDGAMAEARVRPEDAGRILAENLTKASSASDSPAKILTVEFGSMLRMAGERNRGSNALPFKRQVMRAPALSLEAGIG
jgi:hypothetical protein